MLTAMHSYAALLGNNPSISTAELSALLPDLQDQHLYPNQFLTFSTDRELDQAFLNRLGGTILLAKRIVADSAVTLADLPTMLATELTGVKGKAVFSLRFVGVPPREGHELFRACKKGLKARNMPSRYIGSEKDAAKPIQLHDEGALDPKHGCELLVIREKDTLWIGRTVGAQDVKAYTERDIGKPVRDTTVGLLPPKLAQILLNFAQSMLPESPKGKRGKITVFDPFCGTGVIPMEALMRGADVLASDISVKAVNGTEKNLEWARKTYKIAKKDVSSTVWKQDACKPFDLAKTMPDMIATEGTLGPALSDRPAVKDIEKFLRDADELTAKFLKNCAATLPGVPVVMTVPVWYAQKKMVPLKKLAESITDAGFRTILPPHVNGWLPDRLSLLYRRADQFVGREILILKPVKK